MTGKSRALYLSLALIFFFLVGARAQAPAGDPPAGGPGSASPSGTQEKVVIAKISFDGNKKFAEAELLKAVGLKVGDPLSKEVMNKALKQLVEYYRSHGANLSVSPNIQPNGGHAVIAFMIDENGTKGDAGSYQPVGGGQPGGAPPANK